MSIAESIKRIRDRYDLTQDELGEIAGVSGGAVSTWERGTAEPRMGAIQKIADHFNISKADIIDDTNDNTSAETTSIRIPYLPEFLSKLLRISLTGRTYHSNG